MITYSAVSTGEWLMESRPLVLIGGSFNPFTNAHKAMALAVREKFPDATIAYVPGNLKYLTKWKALPEDLVFCGENRIELIEECVKDIEDCHVCGCEAIGPCSGKTYDTVNWLTLGFRTKEDICLCIGTDKLSEIETWYNARELVERVNFLVLTRGSCIDDCKSIFVKMYKDRFIEIPFDYPDVSSTKVRQLYKEGNFDEIEKLVPEPVYKYLADSYLKAFIPQKGKEL